MKKYLILALALALVLSVGSIVTMYADASCSCSSTESCNTNCACSGSCKPNCSVCEGGSCSCSTPTNSSGLEESAPNNSIPTPTPVHYYPDYDEETPAPTAVVETEETSPKTGDMPGAAVALLGIFASAVIVTCVRKSRA